MHSNLPFDANVRQFKRFNQSFNTFRTCTRHCARLHKCTQNAQITNQKIFQKSNSKPNETMKKKQKITHEYDHGQLVDSITLKAVFVTESESFLIDDEGNGYQTNLVEGLEQNKTFEITNIVLEKRNSFSFKFSLVQTKQTKITKLKKGLKKQYAKNFEKFEDAKGGKVTNLKCIIVEEQDSSLRLFDGTFFRMNLKKPLNFETNKLEMLFVKKSYSYKYAWETNLTQILEGDGTDPFWENLHVPEVEMYEDPEKIPEERIGKWVAMLTTITPPFTYSKFSYSKQIF